MPNSSLDVSVIVPAYQAEPFLQAALASVAGQTSPPGEVIVVDDASTDETAAIAEAWRGRLPLSVVRSDANAGLGAARRTGIERSSGALIALLDADDVWLPDHLAVMVDCHRRNGGIVTAANYRWVPTSRIDDLPSNRLNVVPSPQRQRLEILRRNFLYVGTLFARDDYDRVGGFAPLRKDEDWDLWIRMIRSGVSVSTPDTVTVLYRQRADSLSGNDGCLDADLELLGSIEGLEPTERRVVAKTLRRLGARRKLLDGYEQARRGDIGQARRHWLVAAVQDRSIRLGRGQTGSTTLRAIACLIAPRRAVELRDRANRAA